MIRLEHVRKEYPDFTPLKDINAVFKDGEIVTIIGASGSGKSTLLRLLNGLVIPTSGRIFYNDTEITAADVDLKSIRREIGMVFQQFNLFNNMNVIDNVAYPQQDILRKSRDEARENAMELLKRFGMERTARKLPSQLSGGQRQRIAIARTLAMNPKAILFDEPTSALDPNMTNEIGNIIKGLIDENKTIITVTHDMRFAREVSDRIIFLNDGAVCEEGTPEEIFNNPKEPATREFISRNKMVEITIESDTYDFEKIEQIINDFCGKQKLAYAHHNHALMIAEELVGQELVGCENVENINLSVIYDQETDEMQYRLKYGGDERNPFDEDSLSMRIVKNSVKNVAFKYEGSTMTNSLRFSSKN